MIESFLMTAANNSFIKVSEDIQWHLSKFSGLVLLCGIPSSCSRSSPPHVVCFASSGSAGDGVWERRLAAGLHAGGDPQERPAVGGGGEPRPAQPGPGAARPAHHQRAALSRPRSLLTSTYHDLRFRVHWLDLGWRDCGPQCFWKTPPWCKVDLWGGRGGKCFSQHAPPHTPLTPSSTGW